MQDRRILRELRCCPWRTGRLAKATRVFQDYEAVVDEKSPLSTSVTVSNRAARYHVTARPQGGDESTPSPTTGGRVTPGDWAAVIVAIAAILVAGLAVPARAPHRKAVFRASGALVLVALSIGAITLVRRAESIDGDGRAERLSSAATTTATTTTVATAVATTDPARERLDYTNAITPICIRWKQRVQETSNGLDLNNFGHLMRFYGEVSSVLGEGATSMRGAPAPDADVVTLNKLYNDLDLLAKFYGDTASAGMAGAREVALSKTAEVEKQIDVHNDNARSYGLNAACLI